MQEKEDGLCEDLQLGEGTSSARNTTVNVGRIRESTMDNSHLLISKQISPHGLRWLSIPGFYDELSMGCWVRIKIPVFTRWVTLGKFPNNSFSLHFLICKNEDNILLTSWVYHENEKRINLRKALRIVPGKTTQLITIFEKIHLLRREAMKTMAFAAAT